MQKLLLNVFGSLSDMNLKHVSYKNKQIRKACYQKIVNGMIIPSFKVANVKFKMRNLKSTYYQEKKKIDKLI